MFPGLEVLIEDEYKPIKPTKDAIIVNIGNMLEKITNY
jgi:isopenicillin N synthase-like dioxygenase